MKQVIIIFVLGFILVGLIITGCAAPAPVTSTDTANKSPDQTPPTTSPDKKPSTKIEELITQLGDEDFNTRESATAELEKIGEPVLEPLRKTLKETKDPETRMRARIIINNIEQKQLIKKHAATYQIQMYTCLRNVKQALEVYNMQQGVFPDNLDKLVEASHNPRLRLINEIPSDLFNPGNKVRYHLNTEGNPTYVVWSVGKDGKSQITGAGDDTLDLNNGDDIYVTNARGMEWGAGK